MTAITMPDIDSYLLMIFSLISISSGIFALWAVHSFRNPEFLARELAPGQKLIFYIYLAAILWAFVLLVESFDETLFALKLIEVVISLGLISIIYFWILKFRPGINLNIHSVPSGFIRVVIAITIYWLFALELETYTYIPVLLIKQIVAIASIGLLSHGLYFIYLHRSSSIYIYSEKNLTRILEIAITGFLMIGFGFANELYGLEVTYNLMELLGILNLVYASYSYTRLLGHGGGI